MCEPLMPVDELKNLKWAVSSLAEINSLGSYEHENAKNAARGIAARIDWVIRQLSAAGEGKKNMGV